MDQSHEVRNDLRGGELTGCITCMGIGVACIDSW